MVQIEIHFPRPLLTLALIGAVGGFLWSQQAPQTDALGGSGTTQASVIHDAEEDIKRLRIEQDVMGRREDILRAELAELEKIERVTTDLYLLRDVREARSRLIALLQDKAAAEQEILLSLEQIWEAQGYAIQASRHGAGSMVAVDFIWPVEPTLGISALFRDEGYRKRFGIPHDAVDIPAMQETTVVAAADGVVANVSDQGMGFNSLVIRHAGGYATMYGHVSEFLVQEGQEVHAGEPVALSGGQPGTPGAGRLTTGAHLHFEILKDGEHIDPLPLLPVY